LTTRHELKVKIDTTERRRKKKERKKKEFWVPTTYDGGFDVEIEEATAKTHF